MKLRFLSIIPLLCISGCSKNNVYQNVDYYFYIKEHCYKVVIKEINSVYNVECSNFYEIKVDELLKTSDNKDILMNEFFVKTNELFVYVKQWFIEVLYYLIFVLMVNYGTSFFVG